MKKRIALLLALTLVFLPIISFAAVEAVPGNEEAAQIGALIDELDLSDNIEDDIIENLEAIPNQIENALQKDRRINIDKKRVAEIIDITLKKIELKGQIARNTKEVISFTREINSNLCEAKYQIRDIRATDRTFTDEQYIETIDAIKLLKQDLKNSEYRYGSIAKETAKVAVNIKNREFLKALNAIENIAKLQEEQIAILTTIANDTQSLLDSLKAVQ